MLAPIQGFQFELGGDHETIPASRAVVSGSMWSKEMSGISDRDSSPPPW